ncbi:MAG: c-type cytochrome biogenesis protein CcmI [Devosia sp.]|nr:c-type cytochrome biogenesis protein CcmI [Devosia sp.]
MLFWLLAITITVITCAALYYAAAGRVVNAGTTGADATEAHFRLQLSEIESDLAAGKLAATEAVAAKAELARELLRQKKEDAAPPVRQRGGSAIVLPLSTLLVAAIAFSAYAYLGSPNLPAEPLASRADAVAQNMKLDDAVKAVEDRLATHPDDIKGWGVIAPVYMQTGQYKKAETAFRHILALSPPTADADTDLAEALMMQNNGEATGEAADLLHKAAALDPRHVRSRFYLAAEATRQKDYVSAVTQWNDLITLGQPGDAWMQTAQQGLAAAEAGRDGKPLPDAAAPAASTATGGNPAQSPMILKMVSGLSDRLTKEGGPLSDWTRLVRSQIVLGDLAKAQSAYDAARQAYPNAGDRQELDALAAQAGLKIDGSSR